MTLHDGAPGTYWGGGAVLLFKISSLLTNISVEHLIETAILAGVGATVGFTVQLFLSFVVKYFKKKRDVKGASTISKER